MEEKGHILVKFEGVVNGQKLSPLDIDISEIKEIITDIETFLYPTRNEKSERPHISYKIEDGSALHKFILPLTAVLFFNSLIGEVEKRKNITFLDFKRSKIIEKFQRAAKGRDVEITFSTSVSDSKELKITNETNYFNVSPNFIYSEFTLYGEVYQEGGMAPNIHINTKEYGKLSVSATKEQILEGEKRVYKVYGLKATGKQSLESMKPYDLKLEHFIDYNPVFDKAELDILIAKAAPNLSKIENVDNWLTLIREGGLFE